MRKKTKIYLVTAIFLTVVMVYLLEASIAAAGNSSNYGYTLIGYRYTQDIMRFANFILIPALGSWMIWGWLYVNEGDD